MIKYKAQSNSLKFILPWCPWRCKDWEQCGEIIEIPIIVMTIDFTAKL